MFLSLFFLLSFLISIPNTSFGSVIVTYVNGVKMKIDRVTNDDGTWREATCDDFPNSALVVDCYDI